MAAPYSSMRSPKSRSRYRPNCCGRFRRRRLRGSAAISRSRWTFGSSPRRPKTWAGLVVSGKFREDLYYRLNVVLLSLPPLRDRREDIPLLVQRFLSRSERPVTIRQDALDRILSYDWPGNVRELENVITRSIVLAPGGVITPESIQFAERTRTIKWVLARPGAFPRRLLGRNPESGGALVERQRWKRRMGIRPRPPESSEFSGDCYTERCPNWGFNSHTARYHPKAKAD